MTTENTKRKSVGIYFECCNTYGRIYENKDKTYYVGRCSKCLRSVRLKIGKNGVSDRFFIAR